MHITQCGSASKPQLATRCELREAEKVDHMHRVVRPQRNLRQGVDHRTAYSTTWKEQKLEKESHATRLCCRYLHWVKIEVDKGYNFPPRTYVRLECLLSNRSWDL